MGYHGKAMDILRDFEFCGLQGHSRSARLDGRRTRLLSYVDTGAGRTVVSEAVARRVGMVEVPERTIEYAVPIKIRSRAAWAAMRMLEDGCEELLPVLVAVSDAVIGALDLPDGCEVLVGQDYLQMARVRIDLAPRREGTRTACLSSRSR